ncbi:MAG: phage terminase large subunit [Gaiellaceae bacterium]
MTVTPATLQALEPALRAELARRRLSDFMGAMLPSYQSARHTVALCEHLEALEAREIRRLIVLAPPRHSKSTHVAQAFPAWYLGRRPSESVIVSSYSAELAEAHSRRARSYVADPKFPFATRIASDSSAVNRWATTEGGGLIAAGVGGGLTGHGADLFVCDDPVRDREAADSPTIRESTWLWWTQTAVTRLQPDAVILLTMTRWSEADLAGRILNAPGADEWTLLRMPALAEEDDALGREEGAALWPSWFDREHLLRLRAEIGERAFAALYQGSPTSDKGGVFRREWMQGRYSERPRGPLRVVQSIDSAFKVGVAHDYSVVATWASDGVFYYLLDVLRQRLEFPELLAAIRSQAAAHEPSTILIEDSAAAQSALQVLRRESQLPLVGVAASGSKISRAEGVSPLFEAGKVLLPEQAPAWRDLWIEEHVSFPASRHDDMVDTTSLALERLRRGGGVAAQASSGGDNSLVSAFPTWEPVGFNDAF